MAKGGQSLLIDADWSKGVLLDPARSALPEGSAVSSTDFMLTDPGKAWKRGGTTYVTTMSTGSPTKGLWIALIPNSGGGEAYFAGADNGRVYQLNGTVLAYAGSTNYNDISQRPFYAPAAGQNWGVVPCKKGATTAVPLLIDTELFTASASLWGGTGPPLGCHLGAFYKSRVVLAGYPAQRVFFSPVPDFTAQWDTTNSWIDANGIVTGLASLENALLIFTNTHIERLTGSTPPPGSDFDHATIYNLGCPDARSFGFGKGFVVFANPTGVYMTNGFGTMVDLTQECHSSLGYQTVLASYSASTSTDRLAGVLYGDFYLLTVKAGSTYTTFCFDIPNRSMWKLSNLKPYTWGRRSAGLNLYYADGSTAKVVEATQIWTPSATYKNDADGTAIAPTLETRLYGTGPWIKHFRDGRITYDMRDSAADNPTMTVQVAAGVEAPSFSTATTLAETTDATRKRFTVGKRGQGVTVKLTQSAASSKTEIYGLEIEQRSLPYVHTGTS